MKEIKVGDWYYRMMGYGGSDSAFCCVMSKTEEKTAANMFSLFGGVGGQMKKIPVSEVFIAVDERGREHKVSANDLQENGHIGIGTLEPDKYGHKAEIAMIDAELLVETGAYTKEEIESEFPFAFKDYDEREEDTRAGFPMTEKQAEILKAAYAANEEKKRKEAEEEARKFAAAVAETRKRYAFIPCPMTGDKGYLTTGEVSRNLKAVLKHEFPGVKFSVTSDRFSGGDSATVKWVDGPDVSAVDKIVDAFQENRPDYTGDYWDPVTTTTTAVCGGFSYTHAVREYSDATKRYVEDFLKGKMPCRDGEPMWSWENDIRCKAGKILAKTSFPVGGYEIEGIEYDEKTFDYVIKFKAKKEPTPPEPPKSRKADDNGDPQKGEAYWKENRAKRGIEIYFPSVPSEEVRNTLKFGHWRWSKFNRCWYNRMDEGTWEQARDVVMAYNKGRAAA